MKIQKSYDFKKPNISNMQIYKGNRRRYLGSGGRVNKGVVGLRRVLGWSYDIS